MSRYKKKNNRKKKYSGKGKVDHSRSYYRRSFDILEIPHIIIGLSLVGIGLIGFVHGKLYFLNVGDSGRRGMEIQAYDGLSAHILGASSMIFGCTILLYILYEKKLVGQVEQRHMMSKALFTNGCIMVGLAFFIRLYK